MMFVMLTYKLLAKLLIASCKTIAKLIFSDGPCASYAEACVLILSGEVDFEDRPQNGSKTYFLFNESTVSLEERIFQRSIKLVFCYCFKNSEKFLAAGFLF